MYMWQTHLKKTECEPTHLACACPCLSCSYMYLGMALYQLSDFDNAIAAYDKAVSLGPAEPLLHLNYGRWCQDCCHCGMCLCIKTSNCLSEDSTCRNQR